jgi:hypothetical protein
MCSVSDPTIASSLGLLAAQQQGQCLLGAIFLHSHGPEVFDRLVSTRLTSCHGRGRSIPSFPFVSVCCIRLRRLRWLFLHSSSSPTQTDCFPVSDKLSPDQVVVLFGDGHRRHAMQRLCPRRRLEKHCNETRRSIKRVKRDRAVLGEYQLHSNRHQKPQRPWPANTNYIESTPAQVGMEWVLRRDGWLAWSTWKGARTITVGASAMTMLGTAQKVTANRRFPITYTSTVSA